MKIDNLGIIPYSISKLYKKGIKNLIQENDKPIFSINNAIYLLEKGKNSRTRNENKMLSEFLCDNYINFKKIRENGDFSKLEKLVNVIYGEKFLKGNYIIKYGEEGNKFYILLSGSVKITKPIYIKKKIKLLDYIKYLNDLKYNENEVLKYQRLIQKNNENNININDYLDIMNDDILAKKEFEFFFEEEKEIATFNEGFIFGENYIKSNSNVNENIKTLNDSFCLILDKRDYKNILLEIEKKDLENSINQLLFNFPILDIFSFNQLVYLNNNISILKLNKGDYLYKQNENSDFIYFIEEGIFEVFSFISFDWGNKYLGYIISSTNNLLYHLKQNKELKEEELKALFDSIVKNKEISPCIKETLKTNKITISNEKMNLSKIKLKQFAIRNPYKLYKINIKTIKTKEIIGLEECFELKNRYYFVKCISNCGLVKKISLYNMFKVFNINPEKKQKEMFMEIIAEKKKRFFKQLLIMSKRIANRINNNFDIQYEKVLNKEDDKLKFIVNKFNDDKYEIMDEYPPEIEQKLNFLKEKKKSKKQKLINYQTINNPTINSFKSSNKIKLSQSLDFKGKLSHRNPVNCKDILSTNFQLNNKNENNNYDFLLFNNKIKKNNENKKNFSNRTLTNYNNERFKLDISNIKKENNNSKFMNIHYNHLKKRKSNNFYSISDYNSDYTLNNNTNNYYTYSNSKKNKANINKLYHTIDDNKEKYKIYLDLVKNKDIFLKKDFRRIYDNETSKEKEKPTFSLIYQNKY